MSRKLNQLFILRNPIVGTRTSPYSPLAQPIVRDKTFGPCLTGVRKTAKQISTTSRLDQHPATSSAMAPEVVDESAVLIGLRRTFNFHNQALKRIHDAVTVVKDFDEISLEVRKAFVEQRFTKLQEVSEKILAVLVNKTEIEAHDGQMTLASDCYFNTMTAISRNLRAFESAIPNPESSPSQHVPCQSTVKLPFLALPTFDGKAENWPSFEDPYQSVIHGEQLSKVQEFQHLKSHVQVTQTHNNGGSTQTRNNGGSTQLDKYPVTEAGYDQPHNNGGSTHQGHQFATIAVSASPTTRIGRDMEDTTFRLGSLEIDSSSKAISSPQLLSQPARRHSSARDMEDTTFQVGKIGNQLQLKAFRETLESIRMTLRKFASNDPRLLASLPESVRAAAIDSSVSLSRTLGIGFDTENNEFFYEFRISPTAKLTRASVLSQIASLSDPIGWIGPIVLAADLIMKFIVVRNLAWEVSLPEDLASEGRSFHSKLQSFFRSSVPRHWYIPKHRKIKLHGFCDASSQAYGAASYARSINQSGNIYATLSPSKSRVSPKSQITLARLELGIGIHWIALEPRNLSTFVGKCKIWWEGPDFFKRPLDEGLESAVTINEDDPDVHKVKKCFVVRPLDHLSFLVYAQFSSVRKLYNTVAVINRLGTRPRKRIRGPLTVPEIEKAEKIVPCLIQKLHVSEDYRQLTQQKEAQLLQAVDKRSRLVSLSTFFDNDNLLRVRGRLSACRQFSELQKRPIISPNCPFSTCLVRQFHEDIQHSNQQNTLVQQPATNHLLAARVNMTPPLTHSAVDYTGHYLVKSQRGQFVSRKRNIACIFSDNATCFEGCNNHLQMTVRQHNAVAEEHLKILTPGHFITGRPLVSIPQKKFLNVHLGFVRRWERLQQAQQLFWSLWYCDYLSEKQLRPQDSREEKKIEVGSLVFLKDSSLPLLKWLLGRVFRLLLGKDGIVRSVRLKTAHGEKDRHVKYLSFLLTEQD